MIFQWSLQRSIETKIPPQHPGEEFMNRNTMSHAGAGSRWIDDVRIVAAEQNLVQGIVRVSYGDEAHGI
jgi:hypothetical protein